MTAKINWTRASLVFMVVALSLAFTVSMGAQVQTQSSTQAGKPSIVT